MNSNLSRYTILAVDDERANLLVLNRILSPEYTLLVAKSGGEALSRARAEKPDIMLLDIVMPDMNGFEVLRTLKGSPDTADIPVVIITGLDGGEDVKKGYQLGAVDYIVKPFAIDTVLSCVKKYIGK